MSASHRSTSGLFTAFLRECGQEIEPIQAKVEGTIPEWLTGTFLSNGPGGYKFGGNRYEHFFDGPALLRKFDIKEGKVHFQAKYLDCETFRRNRRHNRIVVTEFGTRGYPDPCKSIFGRFGSYFFMTELFNDNNQVTFWNFADDLFAVGEGPLVTKIALNTLKTEQRIDLRALISISTAAAHVHREGENIYAMGNTISHYNIVKISKASGRSRPPHLDLSIVGKIPVRRTFSPSYYHSFCITKRFFVFIEQPLVLSVPSLVWNQYTGGTNSQIMKWRPKYKTRFYLVDRNNGSIWPIKYKTEPFAFFHTINAYEDCDHVVVDICCYRNADILKTLTTKAIEEAARNPSVARKQAELVQSQAKRFVLPLYPGDISKDSSNLNRLKYSGSTAFRRSKRDQVDIVADSLTAIGSVMAEMPTINHHMDGKKYRYFYAICRREEDLLLQLIKCDTIKKKYQLWSKDDHYPSEPIFVPNPCPTSEDDGLVLSYVISEVNECDGFLLFLDGRTFKEVCRARFQVPTQLVPQFHGVFIRSGG